MEHNIIMKHDDHFVHFYDGLSEIFSIGNEFLDEIRVQDGVKVSEWIAYLNELSWAYPTLLYRFAKKIKEKNPDTEINWHETFFYVEKRVYLEDLYNTQNCQTIADTSIPSQGNEKHDIFDFIKFIQQIDNEEINPEIEKLVHQRLKQHDII